ncbi:RusA family crossover junction endodeoxyribonuclease [Algicola sagamiensis]|uniref:RusA family crossover junction endodeoxyribonuclease n=1 Tax=Algicola sagamiensis TaxID=163869 RepID=UPI0003600628|nr:RusA family crossover junction endodeoxyribonuclease [Algicola sagamiensis]
MVKLTLPYPPTVNHYWQSFTAWRAGKKIVKKTLSVKAKKFVNDVHFHVVKEKAAKRYATPVEINIGVYLPDKRKRDLDNLLKGLFDALTKARVIEDDSLIHSFSIQRLGIESPGRIELTVTPIEGE